ncbi:9180_t:CDS:1 [Cetraspora pellucida]|uniref:9180_t:CDS:1 n=1 Tax=Cetraspora pellucida TaxID=1433469 RepID=A0ACA9JXE3_9GLOM|nr:9180_t:CDS:1 [Cetraspora pellucida]
MDIGFNINLSKLVEVVSDVNDYHAIISHVKSGEEFKEYLESGESSLSSFEEVYDSLKKTLEEYEELEISKKIIDDSGLDLRLNAGGLKDFEVKYEKICSIAEN